MAKGLEIFKTGKHKASSGAVLEFGERELAASAAAYDPALHEAPIVVGHPKTDGPAYGWVRGLSFSEGALVAEPHQVDAAFAELVRAGRFKKISASFYTPKAETNPKPGVYYLRHVGFLGAEPPAVKGLKPVQFGEAEAGVVDFADIEDSVVAGLFRKLREWIISTAGVDAADGVISNWEIGLLEDAAGGDDGGDGDALPAYNETAKEGETMAKEEELKAKEEELRKREADFAEREKGLKVQEAKVRRAVYESFCEGLVKEGKMLPALKAQAVAMLDFAGAGESGVVEFGETKTTMVGALRDYLAKQPKIVDYGEVARRDNDPGTGAGGAGEKLSQLAMKKAREEKVSFTEALAAVQMEFPELAREYADSFQG